MLQRLRHPVFISFHLSTLSSVYQGIFPFPTTFYIAKHQLLARPARSFERLRPPSCISFHLISLRSIFFSLFRARRLVVVVRSVVQTSCSPHPEFSCSAHGPLPSDYLISLISQPANLTCRPRASLTYEPHVPASRASLTCHHHVTAPRDSLTCHHVSTPTSRDHLT